MGGEGGAAEVVVEGVCTSGEQLRADVTQVRSEVRGTAARLKSCCDRSGWGSAVVVLYLEVAPETGLERYWPQEYADTSSLPLSAGCCSVWSFIDPPSSHFHQPAGNGLANQCAYCCSQSC